MPLVKLGKRRINLFNVTKVVESEPQQANDPPDVIVHMTDGTTEELTGAEGEAFLRWYDEAATDLTPVNEEITDLNNQEDRAPLDIG